MAVYKDKNGTWYINTSFYVDGKRKYITKRGFSLKKQAVEYERQLKLNPATPHNTLLFNDILNSMIANRDGNVETKTALKSLFTRYMSDFFYKPYSNITKAKINTWRLKIGKLSLSTTTKNKIIREMKSLCRFAHNIYDLPDYAKQLNYFKTKIGEKQKFEIWTVDEFNRFIDCVTNPIFKAFFTTLFFTGARRGEILALHKEDLQGNMITINKSIRNIKRGINPPKNQSSIRSIPLDNKTLALIQSLLKYDGDFLFGGKSPIANTTIDRVFKKAIKDSGVKPIRLHDFRHSHASFLINNGINIVAVSKRLGHSNVEITLKTYTHLLEKTNNKLIDFLNSI